MSKINLSIWQSTGRCVQEKQHEHENLPETIKLILVTFCRRFFPISLLLEQLPLLPQLLNSVLRSTSEYDIVSVRHQDEGVAAGNVRRNLGLKLPEIIDENFGT